MSSVSFSLLPSGKEWRRRQKPEDVQYLNAFEEERFLIAQANCEIDPDSGKLVGRVTCRYRDQVENMTPRSGVYGRFPKQVVSVAAGLIPFLEHDDANRALMGSNMQRQAVPLLQSESPLVGTGIEKKVPKIPAP